MRVKPGPRFAIELLTGTVSLVMSVVTSFWPQWIEAAFEFAPDAGSGETEWGLTAGLWIFTVVMFIAARLEWRRAAAARAAG